MGFVGDSVVFPELAALALVHDLEEVEAGDTSVCDEEGFKTKV